MVEESSPLVPPAEESIEAEPDTAHESEPESGEPTPEPASETGFVCDCKERMRSACKGLAFYKEHEGKRYCVLHDPDKEKSADFKAALDSKLNKNDFDFRGVWFPDPVDFRGFEFSADADFSEATFSTDADFISATFSAAAYFSSATFSTAAGFDFATFGGYGSFDYATFSADADFQHTTFRVGASFDKTTFCGEAGFGDARFTKAASFDKTTFCGEAGFGSARFTKAASFDRATFSALAQFGGAAFSGNARFYATTFDEYAGFFSTEFHADANFKLATFSANAGFLAATFSAGACFDSARFGANAYFHNATFADTDFNLSVFGAHAMFSHAFFKDSLHFFGSATERTLKDGASLDAMALGNNPSLDFQHSRIEHPERMTFHTLNLRPHWFVNVDSRQFVFTDVGWDWERISVKQEIAALAAKSVSSPNHLLAIACRQLAENAEANNRYEEASRFRYWAMDLARRTKWKGWSFWKTDWLHMLYWAVSGYGERIRNALGVLAAVWFVFVLLYTEVGFVQQQPSNVTASSTSGASMSTEDRTGQPLEFSRSLTYSFAVMSLQKPEPKPLTGTAQTLVLLETILGPVQAALLALAIRRKFMR